ncbi:hypothetical protein ACQ4PT_031746 [Festuca glaucescens]
MEHLIGQINALIHRPATPDDGCNKIQVFLRAFEHLVSNTRGGAVVRCWATQNGWLLIVDPVSLHAALLDPEARVRVDLPRLADGDLPRNCKCLLSHERATSHGCVLLVVDMDKPVFRYCRVDSQAQQRWYSYEYSFQRRHGFHVQSIAAANGDFYFPLSPTELVCMELMCYEFSPEPRFTTVEHGELYLAPELPWEEAPRHLVGLHGELLMVVQSCPLYDGTYQRHDVYRMDFMNRRWTDVSRLGDQVLLLGPSQFTASFMASDLGVENNCVYIVTPEMPMYVHDVKAQFNQLFRRIPADPVLSRMHTLAANACGFLAGLPGFKDPTSS